jgi:5'-deoxynucleotidase YfbR-like HD superfamily hydrolase
MKPTMEDVRKLIKDLVIPFDQIDRDMVIPGKNRHNENDAEHSWSLALVACSLAQQIDPDLDVGRIAQFATVHDLPEVFVGDVSIWDTDGNLEGKAEREASAVKHIAREFKQFPWLSETLEAYERKDTNEAVFVWAVDKLIPLMIREIDAGRSYVEMKLTKERFLAGIQVNRKKAGSHPQIGIYFDELLAVFEAHPEYFYRPD